MKNSIRVVSGIRSTGETHLGHYFGALKNWIALQHQYECFFFAADWHAFTTEYKDTSHIRSFALNNVADWLALGLHPEKATIFIQSHVPEHAELYLIFSMMTPLGWLERNPTYKEQIQQLQNKDLSMLGFLGYPVLQAADIALYRGTQVPVGEDQLSHLELTREIIRRFNHLYGNLLLEPEALLSDAPKLLGSDGRKMSNSYGNAIYLSDAKKVVIDKVMTYMTDPARKRRQDPGDPFKCPLFTLHQRFSGVPVIHDVISGCQTAGIGCIDCKKKLLESLTPWHDAFLERRHDLTVHPKKVEEILEAGVRKATLEAQKTLLDVRGALKL